MKLFIYMSTSLKEQEIIYILLKELKKTNQLIQMFGEKGYEKSSNNGRWIWNKTASINDEYSKTYGTFNECTNDGTYSSFIKESSYNRYCFLTLLSSRIYYFSFW